jgi:integrase
MPGENPNGRHKRNILAATHYAQTTQPLPAMAVPRASSIFADFRWIGPTLTIPALDRPNLKAHPHMLRHACGYALANKGHDTRAIQGWLGHRSITTRPSTPRWRRTGSENFWPD